MRRQIYRMDQETEITKGRLLKLHRQGRIKILPPKHMGKDTKFILKSKTIDAIIILVVLIGGQIFNIDIANEEISTIVYSAMAVLAGVLGVWGRMKASKGLTITPTKKEVEPSSEE